MRKKNVGIVGYRGMVGSVLCERLAAHGDFERFEPHFFSTTQVGDASDPLTLGRPAEDASDRKRLAQMDILVSCQGGAYTESVLGPLRSDGYRGLFIDAASTLRMDDDTVIVLDPINRLAIDEALARGVRNFAGGNCTVSLMLMAVGELYRRGWVEWISTMTYQAASGAGARPMRELIAQMKFIADRTGAALESAASGALELDRAVLSAQRDPALPTADIGAPLAANLLPFIDREMGDGSSREEWKGHEESNKILGNDPAIPVDGICVRVGAMRCHSQALTIKLRKDVPLGDVAQALAMSTPWSRVVPNERAATMAHLTPAAISGTLDVAVGRVKKLKLGPQYVGLFTVGDQLLWGAAEPLRRTLMIALGDPTSL